MSYRHYSALGALQMVQLPNWIDMLAAQKNEARVRFGSTSIPMPGRSDIHYANITGDHVKKLIAYWAPQLEKIQNSPALWIGQTANHDAWKREYDRYRLVAVGVSATGSAYGSKNIPESIAVGYWQALEAVVLRGSSIAGSPSPWQMLKEAIAETALDYSKYVPRFEIPAWMKWVGIGGLALYLLNMVRERKGAR